MWHIAIPIPNWTGILIGFFLGVFAAYMLGWWLNRREKERAKETFADLIRKHQETDQTD